jgi:hypothetical protein
VTRVTFLKKCVKSTKVELGGPPLEKSLSLHPVRLAIAFFFAMICAVGTQAQDAASPKFTLFAGPGIVATNRNSRAEIHAGASFDEAPPNAWGGYYFEAGYLGPWSRPHNGSAFLSADYMAAWNFGHSGSAQTASGTRYWADRGWRLLPFASAGYTRLFGTANAVNFGGGIDYRLSQTYAIRAEVRDYYLLSTPTEHNAGLRIGFVIYIPD